MSTTSLYGFANKEAAEKFFEQAGNNPEIDAIILGQPARIAYSLEKNGFVAVEATAVHTVIIVDRGTPIKVDTGNGTPAPNPASSPVPAPTPGPSSGPGDGQGGSD